jgi:hypothetical protein
MKEDEEVELLKRTKVKKELKIVERGMLNIELLVVRSSSHSLSSSKCVKGKTYNEKIQFV